MDPEENMTIYEAVELTYSLQKFWSQIEYMLAHPEEFL